MPGSYAVRRSAFFCAQFASWWPPKIRTLASPRTTTEPFSISCLLQAQQQQQQQQQQQRQQQQQQQQQQPPQYATRSPLSHLRQQQPVPPQWGMPLSQPRVSQNSQGMKAPKPVNHQHHKHASLQKVNRRLIDEEEENTFWRYKESDWDDEDDQEEPEDEQHLSLSYTSHSQDKRSRHS
jgi:Ca-activated chloride channel homolog